ncbi:MAG: WD40 repeat domain-containing protein, partial [Saprospiraceae bacterium]|nr:WD40 repeat domain-containing protein [Saprospiraceae bacterium]
MKHLICALLFLAALAATPARAQGWERLYNSGIAADFTQTPDGGFLLAGEYAQWDAPEKAWLLKTDADGDVEWTRRYSVSDTLEEYTDVQLLGSQHIIAAGDFLDYWTPNTPEHIAAFIHKLDANGNLLAEVLINPTPNQNTDYHTADLALTPAGNLLIAVSAGNNQTSLYSYDAGLQQLWSVSYTAHINQIIALPDGSLLLCGGKNNTMYLCKTDAAGALIWEKTYESGSAWMTTTNDGNIVLAKQGKLLKVDADGNLIWSKTGLNGISEAWVTEDHDGNLLAIGYYNANFTYAFTLGKYDADGNLIWKKTPHQSLSGTTSIAKPLVTTDGGYALGGKRAGKAMLIRSDTAFDLYRSWISGSMFHDLNDDCTKDPGEHGLKYFYASATDANGSVWSESLQTGAFAMQVPAGVYEVNISKRSIDPDNWLPCTGHTVTVTATTDTAHVPAIGVRSLVDCPRPHIRAAIPKVRSCHDGRYNLSFFNLGTQKATDTQIEVDLADNLNYGGSSLTLLSQNGQKLRFSAGDLDIDEQGTAT